MVSANGGRGAQDGGYRAAFEDVAIQETGPRGVVALIGPDAVPFLHGILTNDIAALGIGEGCYAAWLTPQGRMIADMHVLRFEGEVLLETEPGLAAAIADRADKSIFSEQIRIEDRSAAAVSLTLHGPRALAVVAEGIGLDAGQQPALSVPGAGNRVASSDEGGVLVFAGRWLGSEGVRVIGPAPAIDRLRSAALQSGAASLSEGAADALRIEAGTPVFGIDMTEETIPLEAGIAERAISMTKGCYVGQEVIVRILHRGHGRVVRRLMGLEIPGDQVPAPGAELFHDDTPVGRITSSAMSPGVGHPVALAYLHRDLAEPGQRVSVGAPGGTDAEIVALPFPRNRSQVSR
jgi:folate-binding protein YgfZ